MISLKLEQKQTILTEQMLSNMIGTPMSHVQSPAAIDFGDHYRMFFCSRKLADSSGGNFVSKLFSIDLEKKSFRVLHSPKEEIVNVGDSGTFDEFGMTPVSAIFIENQLYLYYAGWSRSVSVPYTAAIGILIETHRDSSKFKRLFKGPVIPYDTDEPYLMGSPRVKQFNNKLYMFYVAGTRWDDSSGSPEPTYKIRLAVSNDGQNWSKIGRNLISDSIDAFECQAAPEVIRFGDGYLMLYSFRSSLRHDPKREYQIGMAYSKNLEEWKTLPADLQTTAISPNISGTSYYNLVEDSGEIRVFYQLPGMGKEGVGTAILTVEGEF